jgi:hypothetical protein
VGNLAFSLFDGGTRAFLLSGTVGSAGPLCSMGMEASWQQQISKVWSLGFTWVCGGMLLALCSKLSVPIGQQGQQA